MEAIIVKNNGDGDHVSVLDNCITGKLKDNLTIAMRNTIYPQTEEFKNNSIMECVICFNTKNIPTDHYEPQFIDLKTEFLSIWNGPLPNIFEANDSHSKIFNNIDNEFEKSWIEFHRTNGILCKKNVIYREKKVGVLNVQRCKTKIYIYSII